MKNSLPIIVCLLSIDIANANVNKMSLPVKRNLARQITEKLLLSRIHPVIVVPPVLITTQEDMQKHIRGYLSRFQNSLVSQPHLLKDYLQLLESSLSTEAKNKLAKSVFSLAERTAKGYVESQSKTPIGALYYEFGFQWGLDSNDPVAQMTEQERISYFTDVFAPPINVGLLARISKGDSSLQDIYTDLANHCNDNEALEIINDYLELLKTHPSLNVKISNRDADYILNYASRNNVTIADIAYIDQELLKMMQASVAKETSLGELLKNHEFPPEFIEQNRASILEHTDNRRIVILEIGNDQLLTTMPNNSDSNHRLAVLSKLDNLELHNASQYLALWRQDAGSLDLDYTVLRSDGQGGWSLVPDNKFNRKSISKHSKVPLTDILDTSLYNKKIDSMYRGDYNKQVFHDNLNFYKDLGMNDIDVTYAQLEEGRNIYEATGQFLMKMGWSWYKFSKIIYPKDSKKAAMFAVNYTDYLTSEYEDTVFSIDNSSTNYRTFRKMKEALEAEKTMLSDSEKVATIENFLAEAPHLIAKAYLATTAQDARKGGYLTRDEERKKLFEKVIDNHSASLFMWSNMKASFLDINKDTTAFMVVYSLFQYGLTDKQLRENIFTNNVFDKLIEGKIVNENNLNEMRKLLMNELRVRAIIDELDIVKEEKDKVMKTILSLPWVIQKDGFVKKFANGRASHRDLLNVLRSTEEKSIYKPITTDILESIKDKKSKEIQDVLDPIKEIISSQFQNEIEMSLKQKYQFLNIKHIIYFVAPRVLIEIDGVLYIQPLIKIGQVNYSEEYMADKYVVDIEKFRGHRRLKQVFSRGIEYDLIHAYGMPNASDDKVIKMVLELFKETVRRATEEELVGISSGSGYTEILTLTKDAVIKDGLNYVPVEKFLENVAYILEEFSDEYMKRFVEYGYVPVAESSGTSSGGDGKSSTSQDTGFLAWEKPVELVKQKTKKRPPQKKPRGETPQMPRAPPQKSQEELQKEAEEEAERELNKQITQLVRIIEREGLPADTPIWLHLRVIISYIGTTPEQLADRADLRNNKERFFAVIAQDSQVFPNDDVLDSIVQALTKYTEKREDLSPNNKKRMLDVMHREMESIEKKKLELARPNPVVQPPEEKGVTDSDELEITDGKPRAPHESTKREIPIADVEAFLLPDEDDKNKLKSTYDLFSDLMLELDVNTLQDLTRELNKTLTAVNKQRENEIPLFDKKTLPNHLIGHKDKDTTSSFIDTTLRKLQIIAENIKHPEKAKIVRIIENIARVAYIQYCKNVKQLNDALQNYDANSRLVSDEEFAEIQRLTDKAHKEWVRDWISTSEEVEQ